RIREARDDAAVVDGRLGTLGLQLVEDLRQLLDLRLVEVQAVGEKPQRAPDAEGAAAAEIIAVAAVEAASSTGGAPAGVGSASAAARVLPPMQHSWVHDVPLSPRQCAPGGCSKRVGTTPHATEKLTRRPPTSRWECVKGLPALTSEQLRARLASNGNLV